MPRDILVIPSTASRTGLSSDLLGIRSSMKPPGGVRNLNVTGDRSDDNSLAVGSARFTGITGIGRITSTPVGTCDLRGV